MTDETHLTIKSDKPTAISSSVMSSNINALGFNIDLIASKNPNLAIAIMGLYERASKISKEDAAQPDEDYDLALKQLRDLIN